MSQSKRRSYLLRDAMADWRRWSDAERVAACVLTLLLPAFSIMLVVFGPIPA